VNDAAEAKAWLAGVVPLVTSAKYPVGPDGKPTKPPWALNVAFTAQGVEALGYSTSTFTQEFQEGIAYKSQDDAKEEEGNRSKRLGDTGANSPRNWELGGIQTPPEQVIHICLMVQTPTEEELNLKCEDQRALLTAHGLHVVHEEPGYLPVDDGVEHFGFADAISEPDLVGSPKRVRDEQSCVQPGEFILGYQNEYGRLPTTPTVPREQDKYDNLQVEDHAPDPNNPHEVPPKDLGRNGTYMVFRKLHQDVAQWRRYFVENFPREERARTEAKFIGRWPSGAPLVHYPDVDPFAGDTTGLGRINDFCFTANDSAGLRCPIGAHIRRVNPRDSLEDDPAESIKSVNRHRILRRGALYGKKLPAGTMEDDGTPRGVLFLGLNSDLKRQFEFIQQTWIQRPKFNGLYDETDPVLGNHGDGSGLNNFTIQDDPVQQRLTGLPQFVTVKGGAYLFLPGIAALCFFANIKNPRPQG
jgi:Dyp-type peroxidase family